MVGDRPYFTSARQSIPESVGNVPDIGVDRQVTGRFISTTLKVRFRETDVAVDSLRVGLPLINVLRLGPVRPATASNPTYTTA